MIALNKRDPPYLDRPSYFNPTTESDEIRLSHEARSRKPDTSMARVIRMPRENRECAIDLFQ